MDNEIVHEDGIEHDPTDGKQSESCHTGRGARTASFVPNRESLDMSEAGAGEDKANEEKKEGGPKASASETSSNQPPRKLFLIAGGILLVLGLVTLLFWQHARHFTSTADAYTTAHVHEISSRLAATVSKVLVDDNQQVKAGEVIVRLDPRDFQVALDQAKGSAGQSAAQLTQLQSSVGEAESKLTAAQAQVDQAKSQITQRGAVLEKAQLDYDRDAKLFDQKVVARADLDAARSSLLEAQGALAESKAALLTAQAQAKGAEAALMEAQAQVKVGEANVIASNANVQAAALNLSYCDIVAPVDGKISKKTVEEGQRLQPGQALMAVVPADVWVLANFKETQLGRIEVGQRVDIRIDALSHRTFAGTVDSIQEGSGATFSLLPPDNATGNFTKIVQRVPVKIVFDPESIRDFQDKIVPGLSVIPRIDLESLHDNRREAKRQETTEKQNREQEERKP